jgi:hypothetical protein
MQQETFSTPHSVVELGFADADDSEKLGISEISPSSWTRAARER